MLVNQEGKLTTHSDAMLQLNEMPKNCQFLIPTMTYSSLNGSILISIGNVYSTAFRI